MVVDNNEDRVIDDNLRKVRAKIGKRVKLIYPGGKKLHGRLLDRVLMHIRSITQMKDFIDVIDPIEFDVDGERKEAIRFGYYVYEGGFLRRGSQTTLTEERGELLRLFKVAMEKEWFRELIQSTIS